MVSMTDGKSLGDDADPRTRQKRVGEALRSETRNRLLLAAEAEFSARGYTGTTVSRLAAAAGVSVQTLYLTWGSKRELLRGYVERAIAGEGTSPEAVLARFAGLPPRERLEELAAVVAETSGRAATGWSLYRDAAAVDAEIAADWAELQMLRHRLITRVIGDIPAAALRPGLTPAAAGDTAWAIASPESHELLVRRLGYDLDGFRAWMAGTLAAAILPPDQTAS